MKFLAAGLMLLVSAPVMAAPFHDAIPAEFHGTFAGNMRECADPDGVYQVTVAEDGLHYYEADDYLIIGVEYSGSSSKSDEFVPQFNGRFTSREETHLLGERNLHLEMETPNTLMQYRVDAKGEPIKPSTSVLVRCPKK